MKALHASDLFQFAETLAKDYRAAVLRGSTESVCHVSVKDYARHWGGAAEDVPTPPMWNGHERRVGVPTRRSTQHERRWEASLGRRNGRNDRRAQ